MKILWFSGNSQEIQNFQSRAYCQGSTSLQRPVVFSRSMIVLRVTVAGLDTLAQWCKLPNLLKHHCSDRPKIASASRTIPHFSRNSKFSECSFSVIPQVGSTALRWPVLSSKTRHRSFKNFRGRFRHLHATAMSKPQLAEAISQQSLQDWFEKPNYHLSLQNEGLNHLHFHETFYDLQCAKKRTFLTFQGNFNVFNTDSFEH